MSKLFERRMAVGDLEIREASDSLTLSGYASTFNEPYSMGWYEETVDPGAFKRTLGAHPDVRLLINHAGLPLARTTSGTLTLDTDTKGLRVSAHLDPSDPDVAALAPKMKRGDVNQMSFGFRSIADEWNSDMSKRALMENDLNDGDVSMVTYPANGGAMAGMRMDGPNIEAITSALRTLETRSASPEDIASFLERYLAPEGRAVTPTAADPAECGACDADCCDCTDPDCDGSCCVACPGDAASEANSAALAKELRTRTLALLG